MRASVLGASRCADALLGSRHGASAVTFAEPSRVSFPLRRSCALIRGAARAAPCCIASDALENVDVSSTDGSSEEAAPAADAESGTPNAGESLEAYRRRKNQDWARALNYKNRGSIFQGVVEGYNIGGLILRFYSLKGFLPFSQLSQGRFNVEGRKRLTDVAKTLVGETIPIKVIEADRKNRKLVFSEKEALFKKYASQIQIGSVFNGMVSSIVDYGAFVDIRADDGTYPAVGLVHIKELSWDFVKAPSDVLSVGDEVKVKVIGFDQSSSKLSLSIRQLEPDPLLQTLDTLLPKESGDVDDLSEEALRTTPLPGIDDICKELKQEAGITEVALGRQAVEKHVVSQDLELWLSQTPMEDGRFVLLARAGRQVQEVHVTSSLDRDGMKVAIKRVTQKIP